MISKLIILLTVSAIVSESGLAQQLSIRGGNLFFTDNAGMTRQLTTSGEDTLPVMSVQSNLMAFVRLVRSDGKESREVWIGSTFGNGFQRILTESPNNDPKQNLIGFDDLNFSLDAKRLFFSCEAWATSYAVHEVDLATLKQRFVTDGGLHSIIPRGQYKGYLIVAKHRYFVGGGSYDWYWVVDPATGKDLGPLGESTDEFYKMLEK